MPYKLMHITGRREEFSGVPRAREEMSIVEERPDLSFLMDMIERVGKDSQWSKRAEYFDPGYMSDLKQRVESTSSHLYLFKKSGKTIGFCQTLQCQDGVVSVDEQGRPVTEIYKVGLFPEYRGRGMGHFYVAAVLSEIFKGDNVVYLNTRDSNKVNSVNFYCRMGLNVIGVETKSDDPVIKTGS
ncbi:MAG: GNAT family N-acetyltransferase [Alphaproteobacteria bacterium]